MLNKCLRVIQFYTWTDGANNFWSSFNNNDSYSAAEYNEEDENGIINIQQNYRMNQTIDKNLTLHAGSQINANFEVYYNGDSDSTDNAGPCQPSQTPNDCGTGSMFTIYNDDKIFYTDILSLLGPLIVGITSQFHFWLKKRTCGFQKMAD